MESITVTIPPVIAFIIAVTLSNIPNIVLLIIVDIATIPLVIASTTVIIVFPIVYSISFIILNEPTTIVANISARPVRAFESAVVTPTTISLNANIAVLNTPPIT